MVAVDGYSRKIIGMITIPVKNPINVYNMLMKPILEKEGLWEQLQTDQGGEFVFSATVQHHLAHLRPRQAWMPVIQITSGMNHRVERLWPEVNSLFIQSVWVEYVVGCKEAGLRGYPLACT